MWAKRKGSGWERNEKRRKRKGWRRGRENGLKREGEEEKVEVR